MLRQRWALSTAALAAVVGVAICPAFRLTSGRAINAPTFPNVVGAAPVSAVASGGPAFVIDRDTTIVSDTPAVSDYLAKILRASTGFPLASSASQRRGSIVLSLHGAPASVGAEGYQLTADEDGVAIRANAAGGLFAGVQTLLQLLPPEVMSASKQTAHWTVPSGKVTDHPRFAYRGAMLDVARHFFTVADVKRYIDQIALYKINYLHLHLSDDQGWRLAVKGWPKLTTVGGSSQVDGTH